MLLKVIKTQEFYMLFNLHESFGTLKKILQKKE
jgi:hypothetical protein